MLTYRQEYTSASPVVSNNVGKFDAAKALPRLHSPPTPPMRPEYVDHRMTPNTHQHTQHLPRMHSPGSSPHITRYGPSAHCKARSSIHQHRISSSTYSTDSTARPLSPLSMNSAPVDSRPSRPRFFQPATVANQRPLPEYLPMTPRSPLSATSTISHASDREALWRRHSRPIYYQPHLAHSAPIFAHGNTRSLSMSYPPQPATIPPSGVIPGSISSQQPLPDRYVCPSCAKAFSRPSSLRIHVHSHTGEKPFRCPHKGCGKAFSVRSNMKRHQRGCHVDGAAMNVSVGDAAEEMEVEEVL